MDLSAYLTVLRRWSVTILASAILGGGIAYLVASRVPPTYEAEAKVIVGPINTDANTAEAAGVLVQTYAELVLTETILDRVAERLETEVPIALLREAVEARGDSVTRFITITAEAGEPETAVVLANTVAASLDDLASEGQVRPEGEITLVNSAIANPEPVEPQVGLIVMLATGAGLIAALAVVLLIDYFGDTIGGRDDLARVSHAPFLGAIADVRRFKPGPKSPLVVEAAPDSRASLAYRMLGSNLSAGDPGSDLKSLVVLGTEGREGSGEVAANLAAVLARGGRRVRLFDATDEEGEISRLFGLPGTGTMQGIAENEGRLDSSLIRRSPGIEILPRDDSAGMIDLEQARTVLDRLKIGTDLVVLNISPIQRSVNGLIWARLSDAAILVARRDRSKRQNVAFSVESLRLIGTRLLGTVLHGAPRLGRSTGLPEPKSVETGGPDRSATGGTRSRISRIVEGSPDGGGGASTTDIKRL